MNLIAPALCLIAQASFHLFFFRFLLLLDVSRNSVHTYISNLDFIVNRRTSIHILSYLPLCIFSSTNLHLLPKYIMPTMLF